MASVKSVASASVLSSQSVVEASKSRSSVSDEILRVRVGIETDTSNRYLDDQLRAASRNPQPVSLLPEVKRQHLSRVLVSVATSTELL